MKLTRSVRLNPYLVFLVPLVDVCGVVPMVVLVHVTVSPKATV